MKTIKAAHIFIWTCTILWAVSCQYSGEKAAYTTEENDSQEELKTPPQKTELPVSFWEMVGNKKWYCLDGNPPKLYYQYIEDRGEPYLSFNSRDSLLYIYYGQDADQFKITTISEEDTSFIMSLKAVYGDEKPIMNISFLEENSVIKTEKESYTRYYVKEANLSDYKD